MLIRTTQDIPSSEITPKSLYLNRRRFLAAFASAGAAQAGMKLTVEGKSSFSTTEKVTTNNDVTTNNNF